MRKSLLVTTILLLAIAALGQKKTMSTDHQSRDPKFAKLAEQYMYESLAISPVSASYAGYHKHSDARTGKTVELDAVLDDVSPKGYLEQVAFYEGWQKRFRTEIDPKSLNLQDQADWRLIDDNIALSLLQLQKIQPQRFNPTTQVELLGNGLFLPLSQSYAPQEVRVGHVLSRVESIPQFLAAAKQTLAEADPIFISTAKMENDGNVDLIETTLKEQIPAASAQMERYEQVAPKAIAALKEFNQWMDTDLAKRPTTRTWRLGKEMYPEKFRLVMQTAVTPDKLLKTSEGELKTTRQEMLTIAVPMHKEMYPEHTDHSDLSVHDRENKIISEVLQKVSDEHTQRDQLMNTVKSDLGTIKAFIIEKKVVTLGDRDNLKVIATPMFMRGI
jgi:hypothetical protein